MPGTADYFATVTVEDYAARAFGQKEGGLYAGVGTAHARTDADTRKRMKGLGLLPDESFSRARLVPVGPGKVFVRWCDRAKLHSFEAAAGGSWWSSDNVADGIVDETNRRFGPGGASGVVSRQVSAVHHDWSDLGGVVVVRTLLPIKVLVGFGRPVITALPGTGRPALLGDGSDLQFMILTTWDGRFRGGEFLQPLFLGPDTAFTTWWLRNDLVGRRRRRAV